MMVTSNDVEIYRTSSLKTRYLHIDKKISIKDYNGNDIV